MSYLISEPNSSSVVNENKQNIPWCQWKIASFNTTEQYYDILQYKMIKCITKTQHKDYCVFLTSA